MQALWRTYVRCWISWLDLTDDLGLARFIASLRQNGRSIVNLVEWLAAIFAVALLVYLFYALFKPERF